MRSLLGMIRVVVVVVGVRVRVRVSSTFHTLVNGDGREWW